VKVFFDTNVYVREAMGSELARDIIAATHRARWRIVATDYLFDELRRVLTEKLGFSGRLALLAEARHRRTSQLVEAPWSRHQVATDPKDTPILRAAVGAGVDLVVTDDRHLLTLDPYEGVHVVSVEDYRRRLRDDGHLT
jgi:uncharacterized protein